MTYVDQRPTPNWRKTTLHGGSLTFVSVFLIVNSPPNGRLSDLFSAAGVLRFRGGSKESVGPRQHQLQPHQQAFDKREIGMGSGCSKIEVGRLVFTVKCVNEILCPIFTASKLTDAMHCVCEM